MNVWNFEKCLPNGFQSCSTVNITAMTWRLSRCYRREQHEFFESYNYLRWNVASPLHTRKWAVVSAVETRLITKYQKIQDSAICRRVYFGTLLDYSCRLCAFWIYSECRLLQYTIPRPVTWPAICRKRPNSLWNGVILQHDNAPPHKACQTVEKVAMMGRELPPHPPCSQT